MGTKPAITIAMPPLVAPGADGIDGDADDDFALEDEGGHDVIGLVRDRLALGDDVADVTIAASIAAIAAKDDMRGRWLAAFGSPLGRWLASRGSDLNGALATLVALAQTRAS